MVQTCKYFYIKIGALILSSLRYTRLDKWQIFFANKSIEISDIPTKLWITDIFDFSLISSINTNLVSSIIPKFYRFEAKEVNIWDQNISFKEFCFLSLKVETILFRRVTVKHEDDAIVAFEKLVENLAKQNKQTSFWLHFHHSISAAYKNRLEAIIDEIIETKKHDFKVPFLGFIGFEEQKLLKLRRLHC
uniref:Uncharacterized protein n=1 Tax=Panagrolaimus sp. ES5 TaxID=591445 RepID=A0AC34FVN2_9BILA